MRNVKARKIFMIIGKSNSGKDTLFRNIIDPDIWRLAKIPMMGIVPITTRPMRPGEVDGKEYKFVSKDEFNELFLNNKLVERRDYNVIVDDIPDIWSYGTSCEDLYDHDSNFIMINTLEGYFRFKNYFETQANTSKDFKDSIYIIYLDVPDMELMNRALNREKLAKEPNVSEVCRRFLKDKEDFDSDMIDSEINKGHIVNFKIIKNDKDPIDCLSEVLDYIKSTIRGRK